jgi:hypothetical protein
MARAVKGRGFWGIGQFAYGKNRDRGPGGLDPRINHLDTLALVFHAVESGDNGIKCSHVLIAIIGS